MSIKTTVVKTLLKVLISNYFNSLKVAGYKLDIKDTNEFYTVNAQLPKASIDNLISKIKK